MNEWNWRPVGAANRLGKWLQSRGSLTALIRSRCAEFSVGNVENRLARANRDEFGFLGLRRGDFALVREVFLCCRGRRVVFAHSVAARSSLRGRWRGLTRLGAKSLGATVLAGPRVRRESMQFRIVSRRHPLHEKACRYLSCPPEKLWARRSLFREGRSVILVTEVFLPGILELK